MASWAVPGSSTTALARPRVRHLRLGGDEDVDLAVGPELELVDVRLGLRAGAPADGALPERGAERHAEVGALAPEADQPVGVLVVEDAERVVHVGVVDQQLLVLVLQIEEDRVQRIGALDDPVQDQPVEPGHPAVALGHVHVGLGDPGGLADHVKGRGLCLHPRLECLVESLVSHASPPSVSRGRYWGRPPECAKSPRPLSSR